MHWKRDRPWVRGQDYRFGDGQHRIDNDESDAGGNQARDSHAAACHGASVYQWVYLFGWITTSARAAISWWSVLAKFIFVYIVWQIDRDWSMREGGTGNWRDSRHCDKKTAGQSIKSDSQAATRSAGNVQYSYQSNRTWLWRVSLFVATGVPGKDFIEDTPIPWQRFNCEMEDIHGGCITCTLYRII